MATTLTAKSVYLAFPPNHQALTNASLALNRGEWVAVLGPNGSGKTTLARVLAGLIAPTSGQVFLDDNPLSQWRRADIAKHVAFVPQKHPEIRQFTVRQIVHFGRFPHQSPWHSPHAEEEQQIDQILHQFDLLTEANRPIHELSGGVQQRTHIARAFAQSATHLLLDEINTHLDIDYQLRIFDLIHKNVTNKTIGCMTIVHDVNIAAQFATHIVLMNNGRIVAHGPSNSVLTTNALSDLYSVSVQEHTMPSSRGIGKFFTFDA